MHLLPIPLAFADGVSSGGLMEALGPLVPIILVFAIFYFLLVAPMRRRQKALQKLIDELKRGDAVVTNGGIYGEVAALDDEVVHLKVADRVKIRVARSSISGLQKGPGEESS